MRRFLAVLACLTVGCTRDLSLPPPQPTSVSGKVVVQEAGTGATLPAPGARVEVVGSGLATLTDANGLFQLSGLGPPPRQLLIQWASSQSGAIDRQRLLSGGVLNGAGAIALGDIELVRDAQVRGRVLLSDHPSSDPAQVSTIVFAEQTPVATLSGQGGSYLLSNLPAGTVSIAFSRAGYAVGTLDGVDLPGGSVVTLQDVILYPAPDGGQSAGALSGTLLEPDGSAAHGASVSAALEASTTAAVTTTTAADGTFQLSNLAPGPYSLTLANAAHTAQALVGGVLVRSSVSTSIGTITLSTAPLDGIPGQNPPAPPVALTGADQVVAPGTSVRLDGSGSQGAGLIFHWSQTGGTAVTLTPNDSSAAAVTGFSAPGAGALTFSLLVEDDIGQLSTPVVTHVLVNAPPLAVLTASPSAAMPGVSILLDASGSTDLEPTDVLTFSFSQTAGPPAALLGSPANPSRVNFIPVTEGVYGFEVAVSDGYSVALAAATVVVSAVNHAPTAVAKVVNASRPGQPIAPGDDVGLDGTSSFDPDPLQQLTFAWTALGNGPTPACSTTDAGCAYAHLTAPTAQGSYLYQLAVTDNGIPPASSTAQASFSIAPAPTTVLSTYPVQGAVVSPLTAVSVVFSQPLTAANVTPSSAVGSTGATPLAGTTSYLTRAGTGTVTWTSAVALPVDAGISVAFPSYLDTNGAPAPAVNVTFSTRAAQWNDHTPPDPGLTASYAGAPDGGADFGPSATAPSLVATPVGTYLYWLEFDRNAYGTDHLGRWDAGTWTPVPTVAGGYTPAGLPKPPLPFYTDGTVRTYAGLNVTGNPTFAFDRGGDLNTVWDSVLTFNQPTNTAVLDTVSLAADSTTPWFVYRTCGAVGSIWETSLSLQSVDNTSINSSLSFGYSITACSPPANADWGFGAPALIRSGNNFYLATAYAVPDAGYFESLFARPVTATGFPSAAVPDGGALNLAPVNGASASALAATPKGPVLVFQEYPQNDPTQGRLRVTRYDDATGTMVDPLYDVPGGTTSSVVSFPLADPADSWSQPGPAAVATLGTTPYLAFVATQAKTGARQVFVAHADTVHHAWVQDPDLRANLNGSLSVLPLCRPSVPTLAIADGAPVVAWDEACPIAVQSDTDNFLWVKRLE